MYTVGCQQLDVRVVNECYTIHVDDLEIRSMRFDFADVDHLVDVFLSFTGQLESSYNTANMGFWVLFLN